MKKNRIFWKFFWTSVIGFTLSLLAFSLLVQNAVTKFNTEINKGNLQKIAALSSRILEQPIVKMNYEALGQICYDTAKETNSRITVINGQGKVLADSHESPAVMANHADRTEFIDAIAYGMGESTRYSKTRKADLMYCARLLKTPQGNVVVRCSIPLEMLESYTNGIFATITKIMIITLIIITIVSAFLTNITIRPLIELRKGALEFAEGNLDKKLPVSDTYEIGALAKSMNNMAREINRKITVISEQQTRQETILSSMLEAVIAVDKNDSIILANRAAIKLFDLKEDYLGRHYSNLLRSTEMQAAMKQTMEKGFSDCEVLVFRNNRENILKLHGTTLRNSDDKAVGTLFVLNDVTEIKRLENIRKDFVANVSHELKTPVTSIKGFVEVLQDGAINDSANSKRFLEIISRQTLRLEAIINDLLSLSKLDYQGSELRVGIVDCKIADIIESAVQLCEQKAEKKHISLVTKIQEDVVAKANPSLIEQAITNLLDNAIKYSPEEKDILISLEQDEDETRISVQDKGTGIPESEQKRLFERFYRVDKGRSRDMGGTGLGLSIVKHIISTVHNGKVSVESTCGEGSTFTIHLPKE